MVHRESRTRSADCGFVAHRDRLHRVRFVGASHVRGADTAATTTRFIATLGMLGSVILFLVTFAQVIATVYYDPCQL
ncbi:MAG TPA: hypothetical protein VJP89_05300 [Pyrinomonadaceae bacterium]|nr:hypothetical protein [Pyrinomonadaceae bacterium]